MVQFTDKFCAEAKSSNSCNRKVILRHKSPLRVKKELSKNVFSTWIKTKRNERVTQNINLNYHLQALNWFNVLWNTYKLKTVFVLCVTFASVHILLQHVCQKIWKENTIKETERIKRTLFTRKLSPMTLQFYFNRFLNSRFSENFQNSYSPELLWPAISEKLNFLCQKCKRRYTILTEKIVLNLHNHAWMKINAWTYSLGNNITTNFIF